MPVKMFGVPRPMADDPNLMSIEEAEAKWNNLRAQLASLEDAILATPDSEDRGEDEQRRLASIEAEAAAVRRKVEAAERDVASFQSRGRKVRYGNYGLRPSAGRDDFAGDGAADVTPVSGRRKAGQLFGQAATQNHGFRGFGDYLRAALGPQSDPRLSIFAGATDQEEGTGSQGGFFVPEQLMAGLIDSSLEVEVVRPRARVVPMSSNALLVPWLDDLDRTGTHAAGEWLAELGAGTNQVEPATMLSLQAHRCAIYGNASLELLADAPGFAADLEAQLARRLGFTLDQSMISGNGVGKPEGILNSPSLITVAKETSPAQANDTILLPNVLNMAARLAPVCWNSAIWMAHPSTLPQLYGLQTKVLNQAASEYVGGGASGIGRELVISEKLSTLGDLGDILLVDWSKYLIGLRLAGSLERNNAPGWSTYSQSFRLVVRIDGRCAWRRVLTPSNGPTMSCAVTLASR